MTNTTDELRAQIRATITGVFSSDSAGLIDGLEEFVREHSAQVWDEAVATTLSHAIRNDDGITLRLEEPNPWREQAPALPDPSAKPIYDYSHGLLQHVYWSGEGGSIHYGTCTHPYCVWWSDDCTDSEAVQTLFDQHLEETR